MKKLIVFSATWCGPCKMVKPIINQIESENPTITIERYDVDENQDKAAKFNITSVPTVIIADENDTEVNRLMGVNQKQTYIDSVQ